MSFDALLTIVFILFFVVGPLLRRFTGGQQQQPPRRGRPPQPPAAEGRPQEQAGGEPEGPLAKRLEEARRRVLEAMGEGEGGRRDETTGEAPQASPRPASQELDWQETVKPVESFITRTERPSPLRSTRALRPEAPLRTERRVGERSAARLRVGRRPALDENGIVNGMIWHEILSEPVSRRGTRRQPSRLRSR